MPAQIKKYKAAAVHAEPGWFDLELSVQKTIHWINEAGKVGCKLVAFPEVCELPRPPFTRVSHPNGVRDPWLPILDVENVRPSYHEG